MSTIGTGGGGIPPLVSSVAGLAGQQRAAGAAQAAAEGAERTFEAQRQAQLQRSVDDVGASEGVGDRDADGREAWRWHHSLNADGKSAESHGGHAVDPDNERGQSLDLDA